MVVRVNFPILPIILFGCWFDGVFLVFGVLWSIIVFVVGIVVLTATRFREALLTLMFRRYLRRFVLDWVLLIIVVAFFRCVHHVYVI